MRAGIFEMVYEIAKEPIPVAVFAEVTAGMLLLYVTRILNM